MTGGWRRAVDYLLFTVALAWPLDLLVYIPWTGISLLVVAIVGLTAALVVDLSSGEKLRVPFEFWAPAAALAILLGVDAAVRGAAFSGAAAGALLLFVLTTHFAATREAIRSYVWAGFLSGVFVALVTLFTPFLHLVPTAFSSESGVTLTFASSLPVGFHILILCALSGGYVMTEPRYGPIRRTIATGGVLVLGVVLIGRAIYWFRETGRLPVVSYGRESWFQLIGLALTLWLLARVTAKVEVDRRAQGEPMHGLWWGAAVATVATLAFAPLGARMYQGFALGLMGGFALPERQRVVGGVRWPVVGTAAVAVLAVVNLLFVFPGNVRDERQYDAVAQAAFDRGDFAGVLRHMDAIERYAPNERRTDLWRARAALALGLPNWASFAFGEAVARPSGGVLLQGPTEAEIQDFVVQMRDASSAMPEETSTCAYERVLLACDERESALYSLKLETGIALRHTDYASPAPFAGAVATVVGDPSLAGDLASWTPDNLLTLLIQWGADVETPPASLEGFAMPVLLTAQRDLDTLFIRVQMGETVRTFRATLPRVGADDVEALTASEGMYWSSPEADEAAGPVEFTLRVVQGGRPRAIGTVACEASGSARFSLADDLPVVPFTPGLRVYLAN